jgi:hypothetical protein
MHIVPVSAFSSIYDKTFNEIETIFSKPDKYDLFRPLDGISVSCAPTSDGMLAFYKDGHSIRAATSFFRNGIVEAIMSVPAGNNKYVPVQRYKKALLEGLPRYLTATRELNFFSHSYLFLTLVGVNDYLLNDPSKMGFYHSNVLQFTDNIIYTTETGIPIPDIEKAIANPLAILKPLYDIIWNYAGCKQSIYFDKNNKLIERAY